MAILSRFSVWGCQPFLPFLHTLIRLLSLTWHVVEIRCLFKITFHTNIAHLITSFPYSMEKDKSIECLEKEPLMRIRKLTIISLKRCFLILNRKNSNTSKCLHFIYRLRKKCRKEKQMTVARVPFMHILAFALGLNVLIVFISATPSYIN